MIWQQCTRRLFRCLALSVLLATGGCQLTGDQTDATPQSAQQAVNAASSGQKAPGTFRRLGAGLSRGWSKMTSRGPSGISILQNESAAIAARFAADQVPNTLMKKTAGQRLARQRLRLSARS